jgi:type IV fimbrial biogenesis protein FimT
MKLRARNPGRSHGFTLLELMFTIAVAAILLAVGVPSMTQFIRDNRMTGAANDLLVAIHTARSAAVNTRSPVIMCFSAAPESAAPACNGNGTQGWIVFRDDKDPEVAEGTDNNGTYDAGEPILLRHAALPDSIDVKPVPNDATYVAFNSAGFARSIAALGSNLRGVVMCDARGNVTTAGGQSAARGVLVATTGRPRVTRSITEISDENLGGCP